MSVRPNLTGRPVRPRAPPMRPVAPPSFVNNPRGLPGVRNIVPPPRRPFPPPRPLRPRMPLPPRPRFPVTQDLQQPRQHMLPDNLKSLPNSTIANIKKTEKNSYSSKTSAMSALSTANNSKDRPNGIFVFKRLSLNVKNHSTLKETIHIKMMLGPQCLNINTIKAEANLATFNVSDISLLSMKELEVLSISIINSSTGKELAYAKQTVDQWAVNKGFSGQLDVRNEKAEVIGYLSLQLAFEQENEANKAKFNEYMQTYVNIEASEKAVHIFGEIEFNDQEIKEAFISYDLDNNNYIGAAELRHIFGVLGQQVADEDIDAMINLCDADGDGQVSFTEFYLMVTSGKTPPAELVSENNKRVSGSLRNLLPTITPPETKTVQAIKQGKNVRKEVLQDFIKKYNLTPEDVKKAYKRYKILASKDSNIEFLEFQMFCKILKVTMNDDAEKLYKSFQNVTNKRVDSKEFLISLFNHCGPSKEEKLKFAFFVFDEDENNVISREELCKILKANHMVGTEKEVLRKANTIMAQADSDNNGVLSFEEFASVSQKFPNILWPR